ncbi:MAG: hypothetical protein WD934_10065 [Gemmatimonadales bacterium]
MLRKSLALLAALAACADDPPTGGADLHNARPPFVVAPTPLVAVAGTALWPYTSADLSETGQDPVNLIFSGITDPLVIRQALFALDGARPAFGANAPFDCTWHDAIGDEQAAWTEPAGWTGSAVQLACGPFGPLRFHLRLFPSAGVMVANAHFEVLIPGTTEHQVLSWELAEQFVTFDLVRTGLLHAEQPLYPSPVITQTPAFRGIPAVIYNGLGPLWAALGAPAEAVQDPMPIPNDGVATVFNVASTIPVLADDRTDAFTIQFDQIIPKPFCVGDGTGYVYVNGPVDLTQRVQVRANGKYVRTFAARGDLVVTPVDPTTGGPAGASYRALVSEDHRARLDGAMMDVSSKRIQEELPMVGSARGRLMSWLRVGQAPDAGTVIRCGR